MRILSRAAFCAAVLAAGSSNAENGTIVTFSDAVLLDTITLSASPVARNLSETGASVTVVTGTELQRNGQLSVAAQLARLPGVSMSQNGGMGTVATLRIRGLGASYIGVQMDGIDLADPSGPQTQYAFGTTGIGGLSRIEVLRGSQSALYGANAVAGIISMQSWRPSRPGVSGEASAEAGSHRTLSGSISAGLLTDRAELAFSASRTITDGISAYAGGTEKDAFRATTLNFTARYQLTEAIRLGAAGIWRDNYSEYDGLDPLTFLLADTDDASSGELRGGRLFAEFDTGPVTHEIAVSRTRTTRHEHVGPYDFDGRNRVLSYRGSWDQGAPVAASWGVERSRDEFTTDGPYGGDTGKVGINSVYGELLLAPAADIDLSLAARHDDHDRFGGHETGRVALAWRPDEAWILRAVASTGFRAPSLYELYGSYGNIGLKPETSRNFELGAEYLLPLGGSVQATLFRTEIRDRIDFDFATFRYAQIPGKTRTSGVELVTRIPLVDDWEMFGNYTYTRAVDISAAGRTPMIRVPRHDLSIGIEGQVAENVSTRLAVHHVADFLDNNAYPAPPSFMPDYTIVDLGLTYDISGDAAAFLRIENLFDRDYQSVRGYGQPGRQIFVGLRSSF